MAEDSPPRLLNGYYVHVDISDQFGPMEKSVIFALWIASYVGIVVAPKRWKGWVALVGGLVMVIVRQIVGRIGEYEDNENGAWANGARDLNIRRTLPMEPIIFLFAMMIFKATLAHYFRKCRRFVQQKILSDQDQLDFSVLRSNFYGSAILASILTPDVTMSLLNTHSNQEPISSVDDVTGQLVLFTGAALGSAFTVHGSLHTLLIAICLAYDDIGWTEFLSNMLLPISTLLLLSLPILLVLACQGFCKSSDVSRPAHDQYDGLATYLELTEIDQEIPPPMAVATDLSRSAMDQEYDTRSTSTSTRTVSKEASPVVVAVIVALMIVCYACGADLILVTVTAVLLTVLVGRFLARKTATPFVDPVLARLDFEPVFVYIGMSILTLSLSDTGLPQYALGVAAGRCAETYYYTMSWSCLFWTACQNYLLGILLSPVAVAYMQAGTSPYSSPYEWLQTSLHLSMASVARSMIAPIWRMTTTSKPLRWKLLAMSIVLPVPFLWVGATLLSYFHFSPECSLRLGEEC